MGGVLAGQEITEALLLALEAHAGSFRKWTMIEGAVVPYVVHPIRVATACASLGLSSVVIRAALLHDVLEDTPHAITLSGPDAHLVVGIVVELTNVHSKAPRAERKRADRERLRNASFEALTIKALDRADNLNEMLAVPNPRETIGDFLGLYVSESRLLFEECIVGRVHGGAERALRLAIACGIACP